MERESKLFEQNKEIRLSLTRAWGSSDVYKKAQKLAFFVKTGAKNRKVLTTEAKYIYGNKNSLSWRWN